MTNTKNKRITVRITTQELARLGYAAKLAGKGLEQFILDAAIEEANKVLGESHHSELSNVTALEILGLARTEKNSSGNMKIVTGMLKQFICLFRPMTIEELKALSPSYIGGPPEVIPHSQK